MQFIITLRDRIAEYLVTNLSLDPAQAQLLAVFALSATALGLVIAFPAIAALAAFLFVFSQLN